MFSHGTILTTLSWIFFKKNQVHNNVGALYVYFINRQKRIKNNNYEYIITNIFMSIFVPKPNKNSKTYKLKYFNILLERCKHITAISTTMT